MPVAAYYEPGGSKSPASASGRDTRSGSPPGSSEDFVLAMQAALLQKALATWPRRTAPLLEVNCGKGYFLPVLWQCGFDAMATEPERELREYAASHTACRWDIRAAEAIDLPFEEECFDWVICHLRTEKAAEIDACIGEALRVCRRGLMLTFWNSFSLAGIRAENLKAMVRPDAVLNWRKVLHIVRACHPGRISAFYTLCGPRWSWRAGSLFSCSNGLFPALPIGAWAVVRLDPGSSRPSTPMPLTLDGNFRPRTQPGLEYAQKNRNLHKSRIGKNHQPEQ